MTSTIPKVVSIGTDLAVRSDFTGAPVAAQPTKPNIGGCDPVHSANQTEMDTRDNQLRTCDNSARQVASLNTSPHGFRSNAGKVPMVTGFGFHSATVRRGHLDTTLKSDESHGFDRAIETAWPGD
jgi:hypothetical protein